MEVKRANEESEWIGMATMMAVQAKTNVVTYRRVSSENQVDGFGLEAQTRVLREYCERNDLIVSCDQFFDDETGKKAGAAREGWSSLIAYCEENAITTIVIPKLDRLARDLLVQEAIVADILKRGWTILSIAEPDMCSNEPSRKMIRRFVGIVAEYDRDNIEYRMKQGRIERVLSGERGVGSVPYGYATTEVAGSHKKKRVTVIDEEKAKVVRRIFDLRVSGFSFDAIANVLNVDGVPPKSNRKNAASAWIARAVWEIVTNRFYYGHVSMTVDGEEHTSDNANLAIIDEVTWKKAQASK